MAAAERVLLHCASFPDDIALRRMPSADEEIARYHASIRQKAFDEVGELLGDDAAAWRIFVSDGLVERDLPRLVRELGVDLVVMGSVAPTGLPRLHRR